MRILFFVLLLFCCSSQVKAINLDSITIHLKIDEKQNILHVTETYHLLPNELMPPWERVVFHKNIAGYPLLYQRLSNVQLKDESGAERSLIIDGYGQERTHFSYTQTGGKGTVQLSYDMLFPFDGSTDFILDIQYYDFGLAAYQLTINLEVSAVVKLKNSSWDFSYNNETENGEFGFQENLPMTEIKPNYYQLKLFPGENLVSIFEPVIMGQLTFDKALQLEAPFSYPSEWKQQGGSLLWVVLIAILIAVLLRFLHPRFYSIAVRVYGGVIFLLMLYTSYPLYVFMWNRGVDDNFFTELGAQVIFVAAFVLMAKIIHQNLTKQNAEAYYGVLAFPILLLFLVISASVSPIIFLLLPLAFSPLVFWFQPKNANYLGATYYELIEQVETAGKLTFEELSQKSHLSIDRLIAIIKNIPHHPIVIDHKARCFMTVDAVALQQKHQLCTNCGAATEVENEDMLKCNYCHTSFTENYQKKATKPVPEFVEITAQITQNLAYLMYVLSAVVVLVLFVELLAEGFEDFLLNIVVMLVFGGVFVGAGIALMTAVDNLRSGSSDRSKWVLAPLFVFITPLFIFYKFAKSKRIQLHFDEQANSQIDAYIKEKGTVSIVELAKYLEISEKEALEIADYLCGNNLIEAVFDVKKNQLVHRTVWEKLVGQNSCKSCGGLVYVKGQETECMYCGLVK